MSGGMDSINTNFTQPTLQGDTTQDALEFQKAMFEYATKVSAATTAINTLGNAMKEAASKVPQ
ncbi:hypothetical protein JDN40_03245 [Rhodomicrobium vannielii ATCC 17100]|jgi:hypothetical protein|uniref:Uncharacterized protein n=1 Tax=Rhodomicrobium udaipurense TaxID=1202716 RepID=A0A8I1KI71_9HYPH|nr:MULTISPECIES: hypothetical protein [Rhodomicrobium]MBJ7533129.1 hypothetical protein [Rhodomicrobium vannielii ATCC 17100]MBJ7544435.1 hypothetical protein [Rhodomicrobium udaipurense]